MPVQKSVDGVFTLWYKVIMKTINRTIAIIELLLVFPAALFMAALFLREVQPLAQTGRLVEWFSQHVVLGLYVFLIAMPLAAFVIGCAMVLRGWRKDLEFRRATLEVFTAVRAHVTSLLIAGVTLMAGGILVIVAMHMIGE
jgi:ABC-type Fe3+ transport system permease subunit